MGRAGLHLKRSDHRKHGADLGSAPGMPVCASWAASPALLPTDLRLGLQPLQWLLRSFKPQLRTAKPEGFQVHHGPLDAVEI